MKRKRIILCRLWALFTLASLALNTHGQVLSLDSCQIKARERYPLIRQFDILDKTTGLTLSTANKAFLPQLNLSARATYQSEVTTIPQEFEDVLSLFSGQPVNINTLSRDQYQATLELTQLIWDGGVVRSAKKQAVAVIQVDREQLEIELFSLRERINSIFFGILLLDEQLGQLSLLQETLKSNEQRLNAWLSNGVALPGDLDALRLEIISANQQHENLLQQRKTYMQWLCAFIGKALNEELRLEKPPLPGDGIAKPSRPELALLAARVQLIKAQRLALDASVKPQLGLFVQGGYGKPGLNMFSNEFSPFYIGGLRLSWSIGRLYPLKENKRKLDLSQQSLETQRESFLFNQELKVSQQDNEIYRLTENLKQDDEIIQLRRRIKEASEARVANGTLGYTDLLRDINAEHQALQTRSLHEIQRLMIAYQRLDNLCHSQSDHTH